MFLPHGPGLLHNTSYIPAATAAGGGCAALSKLCTILYAHGRGVRSLKTSPPPTPIEPTLFEQKHSAVCQGRINFSNCSDFRQHWTHREKWGQMFWRKSKPINRQGRRHPTSLEVGNNHICLLSTNQSTKYSNDFDMLIPKYPALTFSSLFQWYYWQGHIYELKSLLSFFWIFSFDTFDTFVLMLSSSSIMLNFVLLLILHDSFEVKCNEEQTGFLVSKLALLMAKSYCIFIAAQYSGEKLWLLA